MIFDRTCVSVPYPFRLACHFAGEPRNRTCLAAIAMLRTQVGVDDGSDFFTLWRCLGRSNDPGDNFFEHRTRSLGDQRILVREVGVEAAVRQSHFSHQTRDPSTLHTATPHLLRGLFQDPFVGLRFMLGRVTHVLYMMNIISCLIHFSTYWLCSNEFRRPVQL